MPYECLESIVVDGVYYSNNSWTSFQHAVEHLDPFQGNIGGEWPGSEFPDVPLDMVQTEIRNYYFVDS